MWTPGLARCGQGVLCLLPSDYAAQTDAAHVTIWAFMARPVPHDILTVPPAPISGTPPKTLVVALGHMAGRLTCRWAGCTSLPALLSTEHIATLASCVPWHPQSGLPLRRAPNVPQPGVDEDELYDGQGRWPDRQQQQLAQQVLQLHPHDRSMGGSSARSSAYDGAGSPVLLSVGPDGVLQLAPLPGSRAATAAGAAQPARRPAAAAANGAATGISGQQGHVMMSHDPSGGGGGAGGAQLVRLYDNGAVALHLDDADVGNGPVGAKALGGGGGAGVGMGQGRLGGYGGSRGRNPQDLQGGLQPGVASARAAAAGGGGGGNAAAVMRMRQQLQQLKQQLAQLEEEVERVPPGKEDLLQEQIMQLQQEQQQLRGSLLPLNQQQQVLRLAQLQQQRREQLGAGVQGGMDWERGGIAADHPAAELLRLQQQQQRRALLLSALTGGGLGGFAGGSGVAGAADLGLSDAEMELRLVRQQLLLQQQQQQQQGLDLGAGLGTVEDLGVVAALRRQLQLQREQLQRERLRQLQQLQRGEEPYEEPVGAGRGGSGAAAGAVLRLGGYDQQGPGLQGGLRAGQAQGLGLQRRETGAMEVDAMDLTGDGVGDVGPGEEPQLVSLVHGNSGNAGRLGSRSAAAGVGAGLVLQPLRGGGGAGREAQEEDAGLVRGRLVQQPLAGSEAVEEQVCCLTSRGIGLCHCQGLLFANGGAGLAVQACVSCTALLCKMSWSGFDCPLDGPWLDGPWLVRLLLFGHAEPGSPPLPAPQSSTGN